MIWHVSEMLAVSFFPDQSMIEMELSDYTQAVENELLVFFLFFSISQLAYKVLLKQDLVGLAVCIINKSTTTLRK